MKKRYPIIVFCIFCGAVLLALTGCNPDKNHIQLPSDISTQPETEIKTEPSTERPTQLPTEIQTEGIVLKKNTLYRTSVGGSGILGSSDIPEYDLNKIYPGYYREDIQEEKTIVYDGKEYTCSYVSTMTFVGTINQARSYHGTGECKGIEFYLDLNDNVVGWSKFGSHSNPNNQSEQKITYEKVIAIADEFASKYIDINEYERVDFLVRFDEYLFDYVKMIAGIPSSDSLRVSVSDTGEVCYYRFNVLDKIPSDACSESDVERAMRAAVEASNTLDTDYISREFRAQLIPAAKASQGIIYGINITVSIEQMDEDGNGTGYRYNLLYVLNGADSEKE